MKEHILVPVAPITGVRKGDVDDADLMLTRRCALALDCRWNGA
jgi:hypothetical protein